MSNCLFSKSFVCECVIFRGLWINGFAMDASYFDCNKYTSLIGINKLLVRKRNKDIYQADFDVLFKNLRNKLFELSIFRINTKDAPNP